MLVRSDSCVSLIWAIAMIAVLFGETESTSRKCPPARFVKCIDPDPCIYGIVGDECDQCRICAQGPGETCGGRLTCGANLRCTIPFAVKHLEIGTCIYIVRPQPG